MFFNNFDFLSPKITLFYNNKRRHLSPIGGFFSLTIFAFSLYIIVRYSVLKTFPKPSSLLMYRNFETDLTHNYFNESGLFHFIYIYNNDNISNGNAVKLNNFKKGIIRIFMTYSYNKYEFNSSKLEDNDHWVYDTCHNYANNDDIKYDYSFSSCIKYYYNSNEKKYYSIHDNINFKWPFLRDNLTNFDNAIFATFVEKCSNNSVLNNILGECYSDDKINEYFSNFNNIFISFINNKLQIHNIYEPVKIYSHQIHDKIIDSSNFFYLHDLEFIPFNYEKTRKIFGESFKHNYFMFNGDKATKILTKGNNNLLIAYLFNFKEYIDELRISDNNIMQSFYQIGGTIVVAYYIFYILNYFINERIEVRSFQYFLNDKGNSFLYKHINYKKSKIYSLKSNPNTNVSNEGNEAFSTFKSNYPVNMIKHDINNINNISSIISSTNNNISNNISNNINNINNIYNNNPNNNSNNSNNNNNKNNNNNNKNNNKNNDIKNDNDFSLKVEKTKNHEKELTQKSDNIIVINNGTFMNDGNASSNTKLNLNLNNIEKIRSFKLNNKLKDFDIIEKLFKTYTYTKKQSEEESKKINIKSLINHKRQSSNILNFNDLSNKKILDLNNSIDKNDTIDYGSKQKFIDNSSISLLNFVNKSKNLFINNSNYNLIQKKEIPLINIENSIRTHHKIHKTNHSITREKHNSQKELHVHHNADRDSVKYSRKNNKNLLREKYTSNDTFNINIPVINKKRRKSHQARNTFRNEKDIESNNYKTRKNKNKQKTGEFMKLPEKKKKRHLSLFSRNSNLFNNHNNNNTFNIPPGETNNNLSKNLIEHYKRINPLLKFMGKKPVKEAVPRGSDAQIKNVKNNRTNSLRNANSTQQTQMTRIIQNINLSPKIIWYYLCFCKKTNNNSVNTLNKFRKKLLSEENLFILHFNMFIFKQKYGCKSNLDKINLLEEFYNDF